MKVYILTRHAICNYGSLLQAYATEKIFNKLGYDAVTLDYQRIDERPESVTKLLLAKSSRWNKYLITRLIYYFIQHPDHVMMGKQFKKYQKNWLHLSKKTYASMKCTDFCELQADLYCTGSDQVWGEIGADLYDPVYFWTNLPTNVKKISLASSLGYTSLPKEIKQFYQETLDTYHMVTVREKDAVTLLSGITQQSVYQILDPTLLLPREHWEDLTTEIKEKNYVLLYQLNTNKEMDDYAKKIAKQMGKMLIRISAELHNMTKSGKFVYLPSPEYFLSLIKHADLMITDSFHGTVFALIFNTQFINVFPKAKSNRNQSILELTDLMDRVLKDYNDISLYEKKIDFENVNKKIEIKRNESMEIIKAGV